MLSDSVIDELQNLASQELIRNGIRAEATHNISICRWMDISLWQFIRRTEYLRTSLWPDFFFICGNGAKFNLLKSLDYFIRIENEIAVNPARVNAKIMDTGGKSFEMPYWPYFILDISLPDFENIIKKTVVDTRVQIAVISLAVQKYKNEHGAFPLSLSLLLPKYARKELLLDKFSGKEFIYEIKEKSVLIQSAGIDNDGSDLGVLLK